MALLFHFLLSLIVVCLWLTDTGTGSGSDKAASSGLSSTLTDRQPRSLGRTDSLKTVNIHHSLPINPVPVQMRTTNKCVHFLVAPYNRLLKSGIEMSKSTVTILTVKR
ncbi:hypothetical protein ACOMHN_000089 [Nucella lapillus]